jgi:hypothetical protein
MDDMAPTGRIFMKFESFSKIAENIQISLKCDKKSGRLREDDCHLW